MANRARPRAIAPISDLLAPVGDLLAPVGDLLAPIGRGLPLVGDFLTPFGTVFASTVERPTGESSKGSEPSDFGHYVRLVRTPTIDA
ncbi:hypothetical protein VMT65_11845 [Nocardia sp. CDC153]|uniref:hypothetical protein n=1 Tax=Nocardia sp. CDC153 TaxID=3112167 RepID=UPI002DBE5FFA|nr:hypothetical protein [Nocardia sp. CDC153]MEC3953728.1 hypothetical protein [Nocardia sp. CDC153]